MASPVPAPLVAARCRACSIAPVFPVRSHARLRTRINPFRCAPSPARSSAGAVMTVDAGDHGADRRQLDVVVGVNAGLGGRTKRVGAMRAGIERRFDDTVGGLGQRARHTRTTATALLLRRMIRTVRLLAARRRGAGIVRGLGRNVEFWLEGRRPVRSAPRSAPVGPEPGQPGHPR